MKIHALSMGMLLLMTLVFCGRAEAACIGLNCSCSINASDLDFGSYNPLDATNVDVAGTVSVTCGATLVGANVSYQIRFNTGTSGDALARSMGNGSDALAYNLYTNATRTTVWGDGTGGTSIVSNSFLLSLIFSRTDNFTVYGRLPPGQAVGAGAYSDTITATVIF